MGGDDDGRAPGVDLAEQPHDLDGEVGVEVPGRLVGEQERGLVDDRTGDGDALLLATRQRGRQDFEPVVQPDYTASRQEKQDEYAMTPANYQITREVMKKAKGDSIVLHSLPRMDELLPEVDNTRHARYWQEAYNGVVMRMALLASVFGVFE